MYKPLRMYVSLCALALGGQKNAIRSPEARVAGGCEKPEVNAKSQTWVLHLAAEPPLQLQFPFYLPNCTPQ